MIITNATITPESPATRLVTNSLAQTIAFNILLLYPLEYSLSIETLFDFASRQLIYAKISVLYIFYLYLYKIECIIIFI